MKRAAIYISIFLLACIGLLMISSAIDKVVMQYYMTDLVNELIDTFREKNDFYIDGKMLSIYLYTSGEKFELDGIGYDRFQGDNQYNSLKGKVYKVERIGKPYQGYLIIKSITNGKPYMFKTLLKINKIITYKSLVFNVFVVLFGVLLYYMYEKRFLNLVGN